ncbi:Sulfatase modifying factor 1 precursor [Minicystis rosea]|nr:Sulfatase modifying factor 1 precursor [Minicystis rosea]
MRRAALLSMVLFSGACSGAPKSEPVEALRRPLAEADEMVRIPAGRFIRGRDETERRDESPPHEVALRGFLLDRTLVTREAFARFVEETSYVTTAERIGYGFGSAEGMDDWTWERIPHASWRRPFREENGDTRAFLRPDAPVVMVTFHDAVAYCAHAGKRLPTEAEWEYAMRAGSSGTRYPWGDSPARDGRPALNFWQGSSHHENLRTDGFVYVSPVRAFAPNAFGLHDPVGNVWQWTADWYADDTYARAAVRAPALDPRGPDTGKARVLRGGSWWCGACTCEGNGLFYRGKADPQAPFNNNGFRCAKDG